MTRAVDDHQRRYRRRILGVGAALFVLTFLISAPFLVGGVERDLEDRVGDELAAAGLDGVDVRFSGQDGTLDCATPLEDPDGVRELAADEWGVRTIELDSSCREGDDEPDEPLDIEPADTDASVITDVAATTATSAPATSVPADPTTTAPASAPDGIVTLLGEDPQFSQFAGLLAASGLDAELASDGTFTVFAPTDDAFDAAFETLGPDAFAELTADGDLGEQLVRHHIIDELLPSTELAGGDFTMLDGTVVTVDGTDGDPTLRSGDVVARLDTDLVDLEASNGLVHAIDMVLLPTALSIAPDGLPEPQLSVELTAGRYVLTGTVAADAQRQVLLDVLADEVAASNLEDQLVIDAATGATDEDVAALARLVDAMPTNLAAGAATSADGSRSITGVHLGDDQLLAVEAAAAEVDASVELTPRPVADQAAADALQDELNGYVGLNPITFEPNSADLTEDAVAVVEQAAGRALALDGVSIVIVGHTDSDGQPETNQQLSEQRAAVVLDAFVVEGFDPDDVTAEGRGQTEPVLVDGAEDKTASRRVEFVVVADGGAATG